MRIKCQCERNHCSSQQPAGGAGADVGSVSGDDAEWLGFGGDVKLVARPKHKGAREGQVKPGEVRPLPCAPWPEGASSRATSPGPSQRALAAAGDSKPSPDAPPRVPPPRTGSPRRVSRRWGSHVVGVAGPHRDPPP
jgi:hypothetical protein